MNQNRMFQLTAARRRLPFGYDADLDMDEFQLTAARRRLPSEGKFQCFHGVFQLTAARRRLLDLRL